MAWRGIIIEQSLRHKSLLDIVQIIHRKEAILEDEANRGNFTFDKIEVYD